MFVNGENKIEIQEVCFKDINSSSLTFMFEFCLSKQKGRRGEGKRGYWHSFCCISIYLGFFKTLCIFGTIFLKLQLKFKAVAEEQLK